MEENVQQVDGLKSSTLKSEEIEQSEVANQDVVEIKS